MAKKTAPPPPETEAAAPAQPPAPAAEGTPVPAPSATAEKQAAPSDGKKKTRPGRGTPRGKKLKNHLKNQQQRLAKEGPAPLKKAVSLLKSMKRAKFDETVEIHMWLGIDPTQSDQLVRGAVSLPHGIG